jgi:hypothetical protein
MYKKLLSFALTLSLIGSSFAAVTDFAQPQTEQQKIAQFKEAVKTATEAATKIYPNHDYKAAASIGAVAYALTTPIMARFVHILIPFLEKSKLSYTQQLSAFLSAFFLTSAVLPTLYLCGYDRWKQSREANKAETIVKNIIDFYRQNPDSHAPDAASKVIAELDAYSRTNNDALPPHCNAKQVLLSLVHSHIDPVISTIIDTDSERGLVLAPLIGAPSGILTVPSGIIVANALVAPDTAPLLGAASATAALFGATTFVLYEKWLQFRENKKARIKIESLVNYFSENPDKLNTEQMAVFAPLIAEKGALKIENPQAILAQLQAVL